MLLSTAPTAAARLHCKPAPRALATLLLGAALAGCAGAPVGSRLATRWQASPNHDERRPNYVILHHTTSDTVEQGLRSLTDTLQKVSAHYLIGREGEIIQLVDERRRAWHAGASYWGGQRDLNSASIGIELDNNGDEPFAEPQIASLIALLEDLRARYAIPAANVIGHADVAPRRKADPSRRFPWRRLASQGFGLWCETPYPPAPPGLDRLLALQALGYDVARPAAAAAAFMLHFMPESVAEPQLAALDGGLLACLVDRKRGAAPAQPGR